MKNLEIDGDQNNNDKINNVNINDFNNNILA